MADSVVIIGIRRARERIPAYEIKQMAGRAGRVQGGSIGMVDIVVGNSDIENIQDELNEDENFAVYSVFDDVDELCFHMISEVVNGKVKNISDANNWYSRSLANFLGQKADIEEAIELLIEHNAIVSNGGIYTATPVGNISSQLYFHPFNINAWKDNFDSIFNLEIEDESVAVAWALATIPKDRKSANIRQYREYSQVYRDKIKSLNLDIEDGTFSSGMLWWNLLGGPSMGKLNSSIAECQYDFDRVHRALIMLNSMCSYWGKDKFFDDLKIQVKYKIPRNMVPLCKLQGIGKINAYELYNIGVRNKTDLEKYMDDIEATGDLRLVNSVKKIINGNN